MKQKAFLVLLFSIISISSFSQVFRIGTGLGFSLNPKRVGLNVNLLELGIAPNPQMEYGSYFGLAANSRRRLTSVNGSLDLRYGFQGKYYFTETGLKPYTGLQVGLLSGIVGNAAILGNENGIKKGTRFQVAPMAGVKYGPLNVNLAYQQGLKLNVGLLFSFGEYR